MYPFDFGQDRGASVNKTAGITNSKPRILLTLVTMSLAKSGRIPKNYDISLLQFRIYLMTHAAQSVDISLYESKI